jgi:C-terminal processing protease CtpA/Prc
MKNMLIIMVFIVPLSLYGDQEMIGYMGVVTQELTEAMMIALDVDHGLLIESVDDGSPAELAGLMTGDIIISLDDQKITDRKILKRTVANKPNERVTVTVDRRGKKVTKSLTLGQREKSKLRFEVDIPDIPDLKVILGTKEMRENLARLEEEVEELRRELEKIKEQIK